MKLQNSIHLALVVLFGILCLVEQINAEELRSLLRNRVAMKSRELGIKKAFKKAGKSAKNVANDVAKGTEDVANDIGDGFNDEVIKPIDQYYKWGKSDTSSNLKEASTMVRISDQMYEEDPRSIEEYEFKWRTTDSGSRVGLFYDSTSQKCVVAYRGTKTSSTQNLYSDLSAASTATVKVGGKYVVNKSFYQYYHNSETSIKDQLSKYTCSEVICTGHSLGAAGAAIAHADGLCNRAVTFEAPRVFKGGCDSAIRETARRYIMSGGANLSLVNNALPNSAFDPIPSIPSGFFHCAGTNVHISSYSNWEGKMKYKNEEVNEKTPTSGANFVIHSSGNQISWFRKAGYT